MAIEIAKVERIGCMCGMHDVECPCGGLFARGCEGEPTPKLECPHCGRKFTKETLPNTRPSDRTLQAPRRGDQEK